MPSSAPATAVIVGSGIVGASTAYFLTQRGVKVTLLDAAAPAAEATGAADGAVSVASKRPGAMMEAALAGVALYRELAEGGLFADVFKSRSTFIVAASDAERDVLLRPCRSAFQCRRQGRAAGAARHATALFRSVGGCQARRRSA